MRSQEPTLGFQGLCNRTRQAWDESQPRMHQSTSEYSRPKETSTEVKIGRRTCLGLKTLPPACHLRPCVPQSRLDSRAPPKNNKKNAAGSCSTPERIPEPHSKHSEVLTNAILAAWSRWHHAHARGEFLSGGFMIRAASTTSFTCTSLRLLYPALYARHHELLYAPCSSVLEQLENAMIIIRYCRIGGTRLYYIY